MGNFFQLVALSCLDRSLPSPVIGRPPNAGFFSASRRMPVNTSIDQEGCALA